MATLSQKLKLFRGLFTGNIAYNAPFYVTVDVTQQCNLQCLCCPYHSPILNKSSSNIQKWQDIPFDRFENLCDELKIMGTNLLIFSGEGEPLLYPSIANLISIAKSKALQIMLLTNGTLLDKSNMKSLINSFVNILNVSLWASSTKEYEMNYPGSNPNNFEKIIDNLKLLADLKTRERRSLPQVVLYCPINRHTFQTIGNFVDIAYTTKCNSLFFSPLYTHQDKFASYALSSDEEIRVKSLLIDIREKLESLSINHNINEILLDYYNDDKSAVKKLPCYIAWYHARIKMDGRVYACQRCDILMGNLLESNFEEIWNGESFRLFRKNARLKKSLLYKDKNFDFNCGFCCHVKNNKQIHQFARWFLLFQSKQSWENICLKI
ncbi:MAG: radical SAM protein [Candidatus Brocadiales bacterium]|nr:radical SAM protein [Candidatus Brocadiales bacterium]